jgi:hypothetical protein
MKIYIDLSCIQYRVDTGENRPMTDREAGTEIMTWLPESGPTPKKNLYNLLFFFINEALQKFRNQRRMDLKD